MPLCERCGCEHDGTYGSGRYCSRSCANTRSHSEITKQKISESVKKHIKNSLTNVTDIKSQSILDNNLEDRAETDKQTRKQQFLDCFSKECVGNFRFVSHPSIDFGNNYIVTDYGDVISLTTFKPLKRVHFSNDRFNDGYQRVMLSDVCGKQHMMTIHRLVAIAFIDNPDNLPLVNHKDCNPENNNVNNLEWCTYRYNCIYNDAHIKRGIKISNTVRQNGGPWNKGKKMSK